MRREANAERFLSSWVGGKNIYIRKGIFVKGFNESRSIRGTLDALRRGSGDRKGTQRKKNLEKGEEG